MSVVSAAVAAHEPNAFRAILWGGLVAGAMDLTAACIQWGLKGVTPARIMQSIASGLLGADAYTGGAATAALGFVLHFIIATGAATTYYLASRKLAFLIQQPFLWGPLFGVAVYFFMQLVVLPLSRFPQKVTFTAMSLFLGLLVHIFCIGLPIALAVKWNSK